MKYKDLSYLNYEFRVFENGSVYRKPRKVKCANRSDFTLKGGLVSFQNAKNGYLYTILKQAGQQHIVYAHRLVALAWLPNPKNLPQVNHKDEDRQNNRPNNLEWCDASYNINYSYAKHHSAGKPRRSCSALKDGVVVETFSSAAEAARILNERRGISGKAGRGNISSACRGELKTAYGFSWRYNN